ncbi:tape measure protein [Bacillus sp. YC2]|uniref:tape measure protein n=1 Tax=Bacillus sp. YC2 TaxID=2861287 RepID=UPI001CA7987D|nr:tape measure protein [Bacillus sp. YC2]MBY8913314.1 tape measure protein [Bacillus sp. YC2]
MGQALRTTAVELNLIMNSKPLQQMNQQVDRVLNNVRQAARPVQTMQRNFQQTTRTMKGANRSLRLVTGNVETLSRGLRDVNGNSQSMNRNINQTTTRLTQMNRGASTVNRTMRVTNSQMDVMRNRLADTSRGSDTTARSFSTLGNQTTRNFNRMTSNVQGFSRNFSNADRTVTSGMQSMNSSTARAVGNMNSAIRTVPINASSMASGVSASVAKGIVTPFREATSVVKGYAGALGLLSAGALAGTGMNRLSAIEQAKTSLSVLMGDAKKAQGFLDKLLSFAKTTPFAFPDLAEIGRNLIAFGQDEKKVIPTMKAIGDAAAASGKGAEGFRQIGDAIGAMQVAGTVSMEEINRLTDAGIPALKILANQAGVSAMDMKNAISKGTMDSTEAIDGLVKGMQKGTDGVAGKTAAMAGIMEKAKDTWVGSLDSMKSSISSTMAKLMTPLKIPLQNFMGWFGTQFSKLPDVIFGVANTLKPAALPIKNAFADISDTVKNDLVPAAASIYSAFEPVGSLFGKALIGAISGVGTAFKTVVGPVVKTITAWKGFAPVVSGIVSAFIAYKTVTMAVVAAEKVSNTVRAISIALSKAQRAAHLAMIVSGGGVRGMLLANTAAMRALNITMLANPFVLIASLIIGLGAAFYTAYKKSEAFRNGVNKVFSSIGKATVSVVKGIQAAWNSLAPVFNSALSGLVSAWDNVIKALGAAGNILKSYFSKKGQEAAGAFNSGFASSLKTIGSAFSKIGNGIGAFFEIGKNAASEFGKGLQASVGPLVSGFLTQFKTGLSSVGGVISLIAPLMTGIGLSIAGVTGPIGILISAFVSLIGYIYRLSQTNETVKNALVTAWTAISSVISSVLTALQPIFEVFKDTFKEFADQLGPEFQKTAQVMSESLATLQPAFSELGSAFGELAQTIQPILQQVTGSFAQLIPQILPIIGQLISVWVNLQSTLLSGAMTVITSVLPILAQAFMQIMPVILQVVQAVFGLLPSLISAIIPVIMQIIQAVLPILLQVVQMVFPAVLQIIQAVLPIVLQLITALMPVILQIVNTVLPMLLSVIQAVFPIILAVIRAVLPIAVTLFTSVIQIVLQLASAVLPLILTVVQAVFPIILTVIQAVIPIVTALLKGVMIVITYILIPAIRLILAVIQIVFPLVLSVITTVINAISVVIRFLCKVFNSVVTTVTSVKNAIVDRWTYIKNKVSELAHRLWENVTNKFNDIVDAAKALPGKIGDGIKNMSKHALSGIISLGNSMKDAMAKAVNGVIGGVNWVLDKIGVSKIPEWKPANFKMPKYAHGTGAHPGGPAILGDGKGSNAGSELFRTPSGHMGLSPATDTMMNLPKGTEVLSAKQTRAALSMMPAYAKGTGGNFLTKAWDGAKAAVGKVKDVALDVFDYIGHPSKLLTKVLEKMGVSAPSMPGSFGDMAKGAFTFIKDKAVGFVKGKMASYAESFSGGGSKAVKKWVAQALSIKGLGPQFAGALETIAMKESGGNPNVVNNWDSNAKAGHPSQGLMQFIPSTFNAHKEPGHGNIKNPVDQILASINYLNSRYGGILKHPGLKSMAHGGPYVGYAKGGTSPGAGGAKMAVLNERGYDETTITTDPRYRERNLGLWARVGHDLGVETGYTPGTAATTSTGSGSSVQFNPTIYVQVNSKEGENTEGNIKRAIKEVIEESYASIMDMYSPEGDY